MPILNDAISIGFFYGSVQNRICGASMLLKIIKYHVIFLNMGVSLGTNTKTTLIEL